MEIEEFVIPAPVLNEVREAVLRADGNEWFTYLYCGYSGGRLLATAHHPVDADDHITQQRGGCRVDPQVEVDHLSECISTYGRVPCLGHSHPFSMDGPVRFSGLDESMMADTTDWVRSAFPEDGRDPVFIVVGQRTVRVGQYDTAAETIEHIPVRVLGEWALDRPLGVPDPAGPSRSTGGVELGERHDRTVRALSDDAAARLAAARVGVISAGGIGSVLTEQLARLGVGELVVVDPDVVEESNLNRLQGAYADDVGQPKVEVLKRHVKRIDPDVAVTALQARGQDVEGELKTCDALVGGVDRMTARMWANEFAVRHLVPYVDAGSLVSTTDAGGLAGMEGFVQTIVPGVTGCFDCLDRGDPEQARIEDLPEEELIDEVQDGYVDEAALTPEPAVIQLNGLVASKAVDELVKLLTGIDRPAPFVRYEGLGNEFEAVQTRPSPTCQTCSSEGLLGDGDIEWDLERAVAATDEDALGGPVEETPGSVEPADVFADGEPTPPVEATAEPDTDTAAADEDDTPGVNSSTDPAAPDTDGEPGVGSSTDPVGPGADSEPDVDMGWRSFGHTLAAPARLGLRAARQGARRVATAGRAVSAEGWRSPQEPAETPDGEDNPTDQGADPAPAEAATDGGT